MKITQEFKVNTGERKKVSNLSVKIPAFILLELDNLLTDVRELRSFLCKQVGIYSQTGSFLITKNKLSLFEASELMTLLDSKNPSFSVIVKKRGCFTSYLITISN